LLDEDGRARLVDFGVARMHGGNVEYKTQVRGFVGKLPYTAPEILNDVDASPRSDLYACAVVLHETILGRNVFRGETQAATLHRMITHVPDWVASAREDIPDELDAVLRRALEKKPEDRFESAQEFANALRGLQNESENELRRKLAELLKQDFGEELASLLQLESLAERDEAWRKLSVNPPAASSPKLEGEPSRTRPRQPTNTDAPEAQTVAAVVTVGEVATSSLDSTLDRTQRGLGTERSPTAGQAAIAAAPNAAHAIAPPAPNAVPAPTATRPRRGVWLLAVSCGLLIAVIALGFLLMRPKSEPAPPARFRVVTQEHTEASAEPAQQPDETTAQAEPVAPEELAVPEPETEPEPEADAPEDKPSPRANRKPTRPRGPDAQSLTRAFRAQQPKIEACFRAHAASLQGRPKIQVDFALAASGKISDVSVMPSTLGATPLGVCITKVARATRFPAQGEPVSFAIPVTATQATTGK
jgi:serine/threonine-protein kinase